MQLHDLKPNEGAKKVANVLGAVLDLAWAKVPAVVPKDKVHAPAVV